MEGATHKHVVNLIKKGGDKLTLVVISVSQQEAEKLDSESSSGGDYYDYSDKRAVPISIPETRQVVTDGETYVVRDVTCFLFPLNCTMLTLPVITCDSKFLVLSMVKAKIANQKSNRLVFTSE